MKIKLLIAILVLIGLGIAFVWWRQDNGTPTLTTNKVNDATADDVTVIRTFMADPNLELTYVNTDLPTPYFRVGKVTQVGSGENMEAVDGWVRKVNVYDQKELVNGQCSVYEYHTDVRNHALTAVLIRGLRPNEAEVLKQNRITCVESPQMPKISKSEAETIAMDYLGRALPNFNEIKNRLVYSQPVKGEAHEWLWEDKDYNLPEGLESRPYSYPVIRITIYGNNQIQYWNTVPLFKN